MMRKYTKLLSSVEWFYRGKICPWDSTHIDPALRPSTTPLHNRSSPNLYQVYQEPRNRRKVVFEFSHSRTSETVISELLSLCTTTVDLKLTTFTLSFRIFKMFAAQILKSKTCCVKFCTTLGRLLKQYSKL